MFLCPTFDDVLIHYIKALIGYIFVFLASEISRGDSNDINVLKRYWSLGEGPSLSTVIDARAVP